MFRRASAIRRWRMLKRLVLAAIISTGVCDVVFAADFYYSATAQGSNNGTSCANSYAYNDGTNGWNTPAKWTGDNFLHVCPTGGTITLSAGATAMTSGGSGTSGHPITIKFESGAKIAAPYWPTDGGIKINHNFIVIDGGTPCGPATACSASDGTGIFEATANGTSLANQVDSEGIHLGEAGSVHDVEIKNIVVRNMCVRESTSTNGTCTGSAVRTISGGNNIAVHDVSFHDINIGVFQDYTSSSTGFRVYNAYIYKRNEVVRIAVDDGATVSDCQVHDVKMGDSVQWDDLSAANEFHHDGVHLFETGTTGVIQGCLIYNNEVMGDLGQRVTSGLWFDESTGSGHLLFNNYIHPTSGIALDGLIFAASRSTNTGIYNNTVICASGGNAIALQASTGASLKNNIISGSCNDAIFFEDSGSTAGVVIDYNSYFGNTGWDFGAGQWTTFANWKTACGCDSHSLNVSPGLTAGVPTSGSSVYHAGVDLSGLSITALNTSLNGVARGSGSPWTMGANDAVSSCTPAKLLWDTQPASAQVGVSLGSLQIGVYDSGNNKCTSDTSTVTIAKKGGTCTGMTLNGTVSGSAVAGTFTTTDVNLTVATGSCTLTATDGALTSADSNAFTISAANTYNAASRERMRR